MAKKRDIYSCIDIGTSTVKVMVAEIMPDGWLNILSAGETPSTNMCKAEPVLPELVCDNIMVAVQQALDGLPGRVKHLPGIMVANISGAHITPEPFLLDCEVPGGDCSSDFLDEMLRKVTCEIPTEPLDDGTAYTGIALNRGFRLENGQFVLHPGGQFSKTLGIEEWLLRYDISRSNTFTSMLADALGNRKVDYWCYEPLAISAAAFEPTTEIKAQGLVIDIGAGITSFAIPTMLGHLICEQIAVGCDHLVNDLGIGLQLNINTCRKMLKELEKLHCTVVATRDGNARPVTIVEHSNGEEETSIPSAAIEIIIEARLRELFELIRKRLEDTGSMEWLGKQILLSGDGARFPRITELAKSIFPEREIKIAVPYKVRPCPGLELQPRFNTPIGAIRYCHQSHLLSLEQQSNSSSIGQRMINACRNWWHCVTEW